MKKLTPFIVLLLSSVTPVFADSTCNQYGWKNKGEMFLELQNDFNTFANASFNDVKRGEDGDIYYLVEGEWVLWSTVEANHPTVNMDGENFAGHTFNKGAEFISFMTTSAKWAWLKNYITQVYGSEVPTTMYAYWRANVTAFFFCAAQSVPTNYSADFTKAGAYKAFQPTWGELFCGTDGPIEPDTVKKEEPIDIPTLNAKMITVYEDNNSNADTLAKIETPNDLIVLSYTSLHYVNKPKVKYTTHIIISCAELTEDAQGHFTEFTLVNGSYGQQRFKPIVDLKKEKPELKIMLSFGEFSNKFSQMIASADDRKKFAQNCLKYCQDNNLDGIDLDWEFPGSSKGSDPMHDVDNFTELVKDLRATLGKNMVIGIAGAIKDKERVSSGGWRYIDLTAVEPYVDFISLMNYDFCQAPSPHNAISAPGHYWDINRTWTNYKNANFPAHKLNMGVAFYGRHAYSGNDDSGELFYEQILERLKAQPNVYTTSYHETWDVPVLYKNGKMWCSYDNARSIAAKGEWALQRGMGGIMHWQIRGDNGSCDLQKACWKAMNKQAHLHYSNKVRTIILTDDKGQITDTATITLKSSSSDITTRIMCPVGYEFPIAAQAATGSTFNGWSDGTVTAQRTITATEDMELTAYFGAQQPSSIFEVRQSDPFTTTKIYRNGHLYLLRNNVLYDMLGNMVNP